MARSRPFAISWSDGPGEYSEVKKIVSDDVIKAGSNAEMRQQRDTKKRAEEIQDAQRALLAAQQGLDFARGRHMPGSQVLADAERSVRLAEERLAAVQG